MYIHVVYYEVCTGKREREREMRGMDGVREMREVSFVPLVR